MGCLVLLAALTLSTTPPLTRHIDDMARGFSLDIPADAKEVAGFVAPPATQRTGTLWNWGRKLDSEEFMVIAIEGMSGSIGREPLDPSKLGAGMSAFPEKWKDFDVQGIRIVKERGDKRIVVLAVQVPLAPTAIQVMTSGLEQNEPALKRTLDEMLASLDGRSTWLTTEERVTAGVTGITRLAITILVVLGLTLGVWRLLRRKPRV